VDFSVEKIDLAAVHFTPELLSNVPAAIARRYRVLPVFVAPDGLCIALPDASRLDVIDELVSILGCSLEIRQAEVRDLNTFIGKLYGNQT
jgi:hypothetical protein